jgi:hypothetical protein
MAEKKAGEGADNTRALTTEDILREEALAIHEGGDKDEDKEKKIKAASDRSNTGTAFYRALNDLDSAALCLSGGGIRSASFGLGVIQALATHPRSGGKDSRVASAEESLLAKFHYLSTVSGGGYIGSWLSTGIARTSFDNIWRKLIYREPKPEDEASQIAWLRTYSNYLTPKLGVTSADTWTAAALYVRNLMLNWLVFAPVLCGALIVIKLVAVGSYALTPAKGWGVGLFFVAAAALQIWALRFALLHRPTRPVRNPEAASGSTKDGAIAPAKGEGEGEQPRDERKQASGRGEDQGQFVWRDLFPSALAAFGFTLAFLPDYTNFLLEWDLWRLAGWGFIIGALLYAISWLLALPWPKCDEVRGGYYWFKDFAFWAIAGGVYGAIIGWGINLSTYNLNALIGGINVTEETADALVLLIYGIPWIISAQLTAEMIFVGLTSWQHDSDADREWFGRSTGWFAVTALAWLVVAFLALVGADLAFEWYAKINTYLGKTTGGLVGLLAGAVTAYLGKSSATPAKATGKSTPWINIALVITTTIFLIGLVVGFSALLDTLLLDHSILESPLIGGPETTRVIIKYVDGVAMPSGGIPINPRADLKWLLIGLITAIVVGGLASKRVNINRFSLHALYRNRLIRAFLGATNPDRKPDSFTGFDEHDNPRMNDLWKKERTPKRLFHVINIALNVVSSKRLAWQERKAESFTVSPLHCGTAYGGAEGDKSPVGAYRHTAEYGAGEGSSPDKRGISVGTAMAISGAAASPNMGYHSSPLVTVLLALFNVRLGWWLGNPGKQGKDTYKTEGPATAIRPLFDELFGLTTDENPYVYLSDGGHFENLGLYEVVRRRCRFIVVSDAGCDPDFGFEDLGNALRKISIDLGITITMHKLEKLRKRGASFDVGADQPYCAFGEINYPESGNKPGFLLYIKPCYHGVEGVGVRAYAVANPTFPHEPTGDQFFSESQLESYRSLGYEIVDDLLHSAFTGPVRPTHWNMDGIAEALKTTITQVADAIPPAPVHLARIETI